MTKRKKMHKNNSCANLVSPVIWKTYELSSIVEKLTKIIGYIVNTVPPTAQIEFGDDKHGRSIVSPARAIRSRFPGIHS